MYRGIIEHRLSITVYLRDYILSRQARAADGLRAHLSRRARLHAAGYHSPARAGRCRRRRRRSWSRRLSHPNGWWRDTAQRLLVERSAEPSRGAGNSVPRLKQLALGAKDPRTRLHALWTLDGIDAIEPATVASALEDASRDVRASAVRIAERWLGEANHPIQSAVLKRMDDPDWAVRRQLAASLGAMPPVRGTLPRWPCSNGTRTIRSRLMRR